MSEPGHLFGAESDQNLDAADGEADTEETSGQGENKALGEELAYERETARAESGAHRDFLPTRL